MPRRLRREDYTVGWVCALPVELAAAKLMLDETHEDAIRTDSSNDENIYSMGSVAGHNVVIGCLPAGRIGTVSAATVATQMQAAFKNIRFGLMVGIGGGVPSTADIRLGDVVVSQPDGTFGGVVQYDLGKATTTGFRRMGTLNTPPPILLSALSTIQAEEMMGRSNLTTYLMELEKVPTFRRRKAGTDILFQAVYDHVGGPSCGDCRTESQQSRPSREEGEKIIVHYGTIASGNQVIKNAAERDRISADLGSVFCFEMEAAGLMNSFPCLVIRGICDYSDSHKNSRWQPYAAGTAAAYAKGLLKVIPAAEVLRTGRVEEVTSAASKRDFEPSSPERPPQKRTRIEISRNPGSVSAEQPASMHTQPTPVAAVHSDSTQFSHDEEQRRRCLESLRFEQIDARQMTIKTAHARTCKWLLNCQHYVDWHDPTKLDDHHGFLWIKGKAGTGKSTLMKFASANARKKKIKNETVLSFFFNARGESLEKSTIGAYRSLLLQLVEGLPALQVIFDYLSPSILSLNVDHQWNMETLKELFEYAVQNLGDSSVLCFIDALDECDEEQVRDMIQLFEQIGDLVVSKGIQFRVCFSSRHYPNITIRKGIALVLEGSEGHSQDIANYIETELKIGKSKSAQQIRMDVQEKASGIFMWVVLVVGILNKEFDRGKVHILRQKLKEIPSDLHELFRDILTRDTNNRDELVLCIQWVLFAKQPLSPVQLYHAIHARNDYQAISDWDPEDITEEVARLFILSASKGFAEATKSKEPKVQFIHESVRDFLLKDNGLAQIWPELGRNFQGQSHEELKTCCVNYLNPQVAVHLGLPDADRRRLPEAASLRGLAARRFAFLEYAVCNVLYHADQAMSGGVSQSEFLSLFRPDQWAVFHNIFEKHDVRRHTKSVGLLYLLAEFDMANLLSAIGSSNRCMDLEEQRYGCPLFAAAAMGSEAVLKAFIDSIEVPTAHSPDVVPDSHHNKQNAVQSSIKRDFVYSKSKNFLLSAAELGHDAVLAVLIRTGRFKLDATDSVNRSVLWWASRNDCALSVRLLLAADSTAIEYRYKTTPLMIAAEQGSLGAMDALLEGDNNVDARVIHAAIDARQTEAVKLLLRRSSADLSAKHLDHALCKASGVGDREVAILLLSKGAKVNPQNDGSKDDPYYGNPLQTVLAARNIPQPDRRKFVQLLLDEGADVNAKGGNFGTALQAAVFSGADIATIQLLLDKGADINAQGGQCGDALQAASLKRNSEIVQLLLDKGADVNTQGGQFGNALQAASFNLQLEVVHLLLEKGADVNAQGGKYGNALQAASYSGWLSAQEIVSLLLSKGADVNAQGGRYGTALQAASAIGSYGIVAKLLSEGADINAKGGEYGSAWVS